MTFYRYRGVRRSGAPIVGRTPDHPTRFVPAEYDARRWETLEVYAADADPDDEDFEVLGAITRDDAGTPVWWVDTHG
jgi:hypothetical protein